MKRFFQKIEKNDNIIWKGGSSSLLKRSSYYIFLAPIYLPLLYICFLLTSLTGQFIIRPVTIQGLIIIIDLFIFFMFGPPGFIRLSSKYRSTPFLFLPLSKRSLSVSKNRFVSIIGLLSIIMYPFIIYFFWIPSLPNKYRTFHFEIIRNVSVLIVFYFFFLFIQFASMAKIEDIEVTIDKFTNVIKINGVIIGEGTIFRSYSLEAKENMQLALYQYTTTVDKSLNMSLAESPKGKRFWGVFLIVGSESSLIFKSDRYQALNYLIELSQITEIPYSEKDDLIYITRKKVGGYEGETMLLFQIFA